MKRNEIESLIEATAQRTAAKVVEQLKVLLESQVTKKSM